MRCRGIQSRMAAAAWLALGMAACSSAVVAGGGPASGPPKSTLWVYHNGAFKWPGDWSWEAKVDYFDTAGSPAEGRYDIAVTITGGSGGWQPYVSTTCQYRAIDCFDITPYKFMVLSLKPTVEGARWAVNILSASDTPDGRINDVANFAQSPPCPTVGHWCSYKIPLSAFDLKNPKVLKFSIQDESGPARFYVADVGFTVD
jgi:hypothetical protein